MQKYQSWGRYPAAAHRGAFRPPHRYFHWPECGGRSLHVYGNGRSYGDVCLNDDNYLLDTRSLDRFIAFDRVQGTIACEAGVTLDALSAVTVPSGWFLPVTPGTSAVTLGGAIANDVHGKNHHRVGSFGNHVRWLELRRSDGDWVRCSPQENGDLFAATISGLGLTGIIVAAELQLIPMPTEFLEAATVRFANLDEFETLGQSLDGDYPYTVAWIDCLAQGAARGRGLYSAARHAERASAARPRSPPLAVPVELPFSVVGKMSIKAFNALYYRQPVSGRQPRLQHYRKFFYPLDGIRNWNRLYGANGFLQYQSVVPMEVGQAATREMLDQVASSGTGSFLAVLKRFGEIAPRGMMSFPRPGYTLALDFPFRGPETLDLLRRLDAVVEEAGGTLYPAKDARMSPEMFRRGYPSWERFRQFVDPALSSSFWRRIGGDQ